MAWIWTKILESPNQTLCYENILNTNKSNGNLCKKKVFCNCNMTQIKDKKWYGQNRLWVWRNVCTEMSDITITAIWSLLLQIHHHCQLGYLISGAAMIEYWSLLSQWQIIHRNNSEVFAQVKCKRSLKSCMEWFSLTELLNAI